MCSFSWPYSFVFHNYLESCGLRNYQFTIISGKDPEVLFMQADKT